MEVAVYKIINVSLEFVMPIALTTEIRGIIIITLGIPIPITMLLQKAISPEDIALQSIGSWSREQNNQNTGWNRIDH